MRKNMSYIASVPGTRNGFINMIDSKKDVVLLNHELLEVISKEINENISTGKIGKAGKITGPIMLALSWWNPIGLLCSGVVMLSGIVAGWSNSLKKYNMFEGIDIHENGIVVLLKKSINLKYDTIEYPDWVKSIDYTHQNKKINLNKKVDSNQ